MIIGVVTWTNKKWTNVRSCHFWSRPPSQGWGPRALLQGNSGPALDKLLEPGQELAGALAMPSNYGVGTRSPTWALVKYSTASGLVHPQPKPGSQFTILLGPG